MNAIQFLEKLKINKVKLHVQVKKLLLSKETI